MVITKTIDNFVNDVLLCCIFVSIYIGIQQKGFGNNNDILYVNQIVTACSVYEERVGNNTLVF